MLCTTLHLFDRNTQSTAGYVTQSLKSSTAARSCPLQPEKQRLCCWVTTCCPASYSFDVISACHITSHRIAAADAATVAQLVMQLLQLLPELLHEARLPASVVVL